MAVSGLAVAQGAFTKAQVGDRIRKVEDGVDEFRKLGREASRARKDAGGKRPRRSGRTRGKTATESQKSSARDKKDELDDALSDLNRLDEPAAAQIRSGGQVDGNASPGRKRDGRRARKINQVMVRGKLRTAGGALLERPAGEH